MGRSVGSLVYVIPKFAATFYSFLFYHTPPCHMTLSLQPPQSFISISLFHLLPNKKTQLPHPLSPEAKRVGALRFERRSLASTAGANLLQVSRS